MMRFCVLISCRNRKNRTLNCLLRLLPQLKDGRIAYVVDDGSTDGTSEAISRNFPHVRLVQGNGTLFWAKAMRKAWEAAVSERQEWDGYLWLNDDTELNADAIEKMLAVNDGEKIVVGELINSKGEIVYGTRPEGLFTGNCVFVPKRVYERLGMICGDYSHAWADSDYAMQAKRAGIEVVSAGVIGQAEGHPNRPSLKGLPLKDRLRLLWHPKGWNVHDLWLYRRRNWGIIVALASCLHLIGHVLMGEK